MEKVGAEPAERSWKADALGEARSFLLLGIGDPALGEFGLAGLGNAFADDFDPDPLSFGQLRRQGLHHHLAAVGGDDAPAAPDGNLDEAAGEDGAAAHLARKLDRRDEYL